MEASQKYLEEYLEPKKFLPGETYIPPSGKVLDVKDGLNLVDAALDMWLTAGRYAEEFERNLANFYKVNVKIDLVFDDSSIILPTGATIASFFIKTIHFGSKSIIVKFPNKDVSGRKWSEFIILQNN